MDIPLGRRIFSKRGNPFRRVYSMIAQGIPEFLSSRGIKGFQALRLTCNGMEESLAVFEACKRPVGRQLKVLPLPKQPMR